MADSPAPQPPEKRSASPTRLLVAFSLVIIALLLLALIRDLNQGYNETVSDTRAEVSSIMAQQAAVISDQLAGVEAILGQFELRHQVQRTLPRSTAEPLPDQLRSFRNLMPQANEFLLLSPDHHVQGDSSSLLTELPLERWCPPLALERAAVDAGPLFYYRGTPSAQCPASDAIILAHTMRNGAGRVWLFLAPESFSRIVASHLPNLGAGVRFSLVSGEREMKLAATPGSLVNAEVIRLPIRGTRAEVSLSYPRTVHLSSRWWPDARFSILMAVGFLVSWILVSGYLIRLGRRHERGLEEAVRERTRELESARTAAEAASVAKTAFLANMSHEIRTPLNAITGMAHLIRRDGLQPRQVERMDKLEAASSHLLEVINAVLDLSKVESGKLVLEEVPFDVSATVRRSLALVEARALEKGLALKLDLPPLPARLCGDPTRLQQALLNYLGNAVKFTPSGVITLRVTVLADTPEALQLRFAVHDTGIGVAADVLPRLFAEFEQADNSITRRYGGTGLGLTITQRLAKLMGGEAGAQSESGRGSTFWFTARLAKAPEGAEPVPGTAPPPTPAPAGPLTASPVTAPATSLAAGPPTPPEPVKDSPASPPPAPTFVRAPVDDPIEMFLRTRFAGTRVLLVEDDEFNREITGLMLQEVGLTVDTANDGEEAVAMTAAASYAVILMDMQMPRRDGMSATREIRSRPGRRIPVIALTANAFTEDREACLAAGMDDFLAKPVSVRLLYAALARWLPVGAPDTPAA